MKQFIDSNVYSELKSVLDVKLNVKEKIPDEVLRYIYKKAKSCNHKFEYKENEDLLKFMSRETLSLYLSLYLKYVADKNELKMLKDVLIKNEIEYKKIEQN